MSQVAESHNANLFGSDSGGGLKDFPGTFGRGGSFTVFLRFGNRLKSGFCLSRTSLMCLLGFWRALTSWCGGGGRFVGLFGGRSWYCCHFGASRWLAGLLLGRCFLLEELPERKPESLWLGGAFVFLVVGMMGTQGLEEATGDGTTSKRRLSVDNSRLASPSWERLSTKEIDIIPTFGGAYGGRRKRFQSSSSLIWGRRREWLEIEMSRMFQDLRFAIANPAWLGIRNSWTIRIGTDGGLGLDI